MATDATQTTAVCELESIGELDTLDAIIDIGEFANVDWQELASIRRDVENCELIREQSEQMTPAGIYTGAAVDHIYPIDTKGQKYLDRMQELRASISAKTGDVAQQAVEVHRLKEQAKIARETLNESTESLSRLERQLEHMEEMWESGEWVNQPIGDDDSGDSEADTELPTSLADRTDDRPTNRTNKTKLDPALTTPVDTLKITKGRLEIIEQAGVRTIANLEELMRTGGLQELKGLGPHACNTITDALKAWRDNNPDPRADEPAPLIDDKYEPVQFRMGEVARADGKSRDDNPHESNLFMFKSWDAGWVKQNHEIAIKSPDDLSAPVGPPHTANVPLPVKAPTPTASAPPPAANVSDRKPEINREPEPEPEPKQELSPESEEISDGSPDRLPPDPSTSLSMEDMLDDEMVKAFALGAEAAMAEMPVTVNPHRMGTGLWHAWDKGWQACYEAEGDSEDEDEVDQGVKRDGNEKQVNAGDDW